MRTTDADYIRSVITHPRVWTRVAEDGQAASDYEPLIHPSVFYLKAPGGFCSFKPMSSVAWGMHAAFLPGAPEIEASVRSAIRWMFDNTPAQKLVAMPPAFNWHAAALARKVGFKDEGRITQAVRWRGRLHDMLILGIE